MLCIQFGISEVKNKSNFIFQRWQVENGSDASDSTEPDYGSNPGDMITKAEDMGDHYLLNGAKMWITNGTVAQLAVVWAKLDGVIRGFIVEKDDPGFSAPEMKGKHSLKASVTSELVFQDCKIPKDRILPGVKG